MIMSIVPMRIWYFHTIIINKIYYTLLIMYVCMIWGFGSMSVLIKV